MPAAALALAAAVLASSAAPGPHVVLSASEGLLALDMVRLEPDAREPEVANLTAIDHRFGEDGPTASAGYLCGVGGIGPGEEPARTGPASAFQHFGTFLGGQLSYVFR